MLKPVDNNTTRHGVVEDNCDSYGRMPHSCKAGNRTGSSKRQCQHHKNSQKEQQPILELEVTTVLLLHALEITNSRKVHRALNASPQQVNNERNCCKRCERKKCWCEKSHWVISAGWE